MHKGKGDQKEFLKVQTDAEGSVVIDKIKNISGLTATKGNDIALPLQYVYFYQNSFVETKEEREVLSLLTDRSLYRPGQTVFVKGIAYRSASDTAHVVVDRGYVLQLLDANNKVVATKTLITNEFGSFTTDFSLPTVTLNGQFCLKTDFGSTYIRVEEYKRPTFEITFQPLEGSYTFNDSVTVKGSAKTFSGVAVQGASVKYSITRVQPYWWEWRQENETTLTSGEAVLDEKGNFVIPFRLIPDLSDDLDDCYYTYKVKAELTDAAGETQMAETTVSVGSTSLVLSTDMEDEICKDKAISATFKAENLSQKPVNVEGTYQLFTKGNKKPVIEGKFVSNKLQELVEWKELPSGEYNLILSIQQVPAIY